jgi:hypothetical protein
MEFHSIEITGFWAKVIGTWMSVAVLSQLVRRHKFAELEQNIYENPGLVALSALFFLFLGLIIIFSHNVWEWSWRVIITIGGYLFAFRGTFRLFFAEIDVKTGLSIDKTGRNWWFFTMTLIIFLIFNIWIAYMGFTAS